MPELLKGRKPSMYTYDTYCEKTRAERKEFLVDTAPFVLGFALLPMLLIGLLLHFWPALLSFVTWRELGLVSTFIAVLALIQSRPPRLLSEAEWRAEKEYWQAVKTCLRDAERTGDLTGLEKLMR
jgi:hypothetical protein